MSLEQTIAENTSAILELIATLRNEKPVAEKPVAEKPVAEKPVAEKPVGEAESPAPVTYEQVKKAFLTLINAKGREQGVALLIAHGAAKLPEVKEADYAAFAAACKKAAA